MYSVIWSLLLILQYTSTAKKNNFRNITAYIINGIPTSIDHHPHMALFINSENICGGSVLNTFTVLTAAHCFEPNRNTSQMTVVLGVTYAAELRNTKNTYNVSRFAVHPQFGVVTDYDCDISLVFVIGPIRLGRSVQKAYLTNDEAFRKPNAYKYFTITGWGYMTPYGPLSDRLMMAMLSMLPQDTCEKLHAIKITNNMFCLQAGAAACYGDSGGGVIWKGQLVGIVSHIDGTKDCAALTNPGVYTNVAPFRSWIQATIENFVRECRRSV